MGRWSGRGAGVGARLGRGCGPEDRSKGNGIVLLMRKALAEFIGTALLLIAVIGSGIAESQP
jgi:hypothetical protein